MVNSRFYSLRVVVSCSTVVQAPGGCAHARMPFMAPVFLSMGRPGSVWEVWMLRNPLVCGPACRSGSADKFDYGYTCLTHLCGAIPRLMPDIADPQA